MDIDNVETRLMVLHCIRENALNMRQVYLDSVNYNGTILERARNSLATIEQLNIQLSEMKSVVEQVIITMYQNPGVIDYSELNVIEEICEILIDAVAADSGYQIDLELDRALRANESFQNDNENMEN